MKKSAFFTRGRAKLLKSANTNVFLRGIRRKSRGGIKIKCIFRSKRETLLVGERERESESYFVDFYLAANHKIA